MTEIKKNSFKDNYEIDLIILFRMLWKERKIIKKITLFFLSSGLILAILTKNFYTSETIFVPQLSSNLKSTNNLSGLASLAGLNLSNNQGEISPDVYPEIINSVPYKMDLLESTIFFQNDSISYRDYLKTQLSKFSLISTLKKYTIGLPSLLISKLRVKNNYLYSNREKLLTITKDDYLLFKLIDNSLKIGLYPKEGYINLNYTDKSPYISAQVLFNAQDILQNKIISYKSQAANELLNYSINQYNLKKQQNVALQDKIGVFKDQNFGISRSLYQNKLDRLISDLSISNSVLQQLANQVEQAKLQVSKDTPVFSIIEPVSIPVEKSGPSRLFISLFSGFLGIFLSIIYILFKDKILSFIKMIKN